MIELRVLNESYCYSGGFSFRLNSCLFSLRFVCFAFYGKRKFGVRSHGHVVTCSGSNLRGFLSDLRQQKSK